MHSHKEYMVCCVMDYAGDVKALSEVISSDCDVSIQGYMSEEFMKVIDSIPSSDNGAALIKELMPYLDNGAKVIYIRMHRIPYHYHYFQRAFLLLLQQVLYLFSICVWFIHCIIAYIVSFISSTNNKYQLLMSYIFVII